MEGDPGSRIATEAARLALQEKQLGAPDSVAGSNDSSSAAAGGEALDAWAGETAGGSFWDLDAPQDPAQGSGTMQAPPQSRWGWLICICCIASSQLQLSEGTRLHRSMTAAGRTGLGRGDIGGRSCRLAAGRMTRSQTTLTTDGMSGRRPECLESAQVPCAGLCSCNKWVYLATCW